MSSLADIRNEVLASMPKRDVPAPEPTERETAFERRPGLVVDHLDSGKTTITVPASRQAASEAMERWLLRIEGRFVGAEAPNRNGAMWTAADLLYGQPTVAMGPLNWLHNERKVVGVINDSSFVDRQAAADGTVVEPYLRASSVMWRWLYPQEALVAERAADNRALWYSMECISENVECAPDAGGCGAKFPYATYMRERAKTCEHMMKGTAPRRFENPIFQGGAIIVPPVRPAWAQADADVVRVAAQAAGRLDSEAFQLEESDLVAMLTTVASWQKG